MNLDDDEFASRYFFAGGRGEEGDVGQRTESLIPIEMSSKFLPSSSSSFDVAIIDNIFNDIILEQKSWQQSWRQLCLTLKITRNKS